MGLRDISLRSSLSYEEQLSTVSPIAVKPQEGRQAKLQNGKKIIIIGNKINRTYNHCDIKTPKPFQSPPHILTDEREWI